MFFKKKRTNNIPVQSINPLLSSYLDNFDKLIILDIGAHLGNFTKSIQQSYNVELSILVEPIFENYNSILCSSIKNSLVLNNVVSDENDLNIRFFINDFDETSSILPIKNIDELENVEKNLKKEIQIKSITVDRISEIHELNRVDLLKIDVQGVEDKVLKGALETLKFTNLIWVETSFKELYEESALFNDVYKIMIENDFLLMEISPGYRDENSGEILQADLLFKKK
jgi:FkbM family methyltransferase